MILDSHISFFSHLGEDGVVGVGEAQQDEGADAYTGVSHTKGGEHKGARALAGSTDLAEPSKYDL